MTHPKSKITALRQAPRRHLGLVLGLFSVCGATSACQSKGSGSPQPTPSAATVAPAATNPASSLAASAAPTSDGASALLGAYEAVRVKLSDDQLPGASAERLAQQAQATGAAQVHSAATQLQAIQDIEAARKQFGEVSRALIERLRAAPPPGALHVYECPMAQGYGKWVQREEKMANPYMGKRMLECGSKTEL